MQTFILLMTIQFNNPQLAKENTTIDVYHNAFKTRSECMAEASKLHNVYKPTKPEVDVMFLCLGKGESL